MEENSLLLLTDSLLKNSFDVIIIGAGPGGLSCAQVLQKSELSVLILEKSGKVIKKNCGGGVTSLAANLFVPDDISRVFSEVVVKIGNKDSRVKFEQPLRTVSRVDLSEFQLSQIKKDKVQIKFEENVKEIWEDKVVTDKGEYCYKYLVGADGANSIVVKHLNLKPKLSIAINAHIDLKMDEPIWFVDQKLFGAGYLWFFPHLEFTSVGIYTPDRVNIEELKELLVQKVRERGFSSTFEIKAGSVNSSFKGCLFENIFLVGDAAGLTLKTTGEGIPGAVISGQEVAKRIVDPEYKMSELKRYVKLKKRREFAGAFLSKVPCLQNILFRLFLKYKKVRNS